MHAIVDEKNGGKLREYLIDLFQKDPQTGKFLNPSHVRFIRKFSTEIYQPALILNVAKKSLSISDSYRKGQEGLSAHVIGSFREGLLKQVGPLGQDLLIELAKDGFSELALDTLNKIASKRTIPNLNLLKKQIREAGQVARGARADSIPFLS